MKLSLSLINYLVKDFELPAQPEEIIRRIGSQLGEVKEVSQLGAIYAEPLLVKVVSSEPLAASDHLSLCRIDDRGQRQGVERGEDGLIQVVCGAPNVKGGQVAVWLPPGSVVPSSAANEPFKLEARKIMDHVSNGMLASAKELALSSDHTGIVVLQPDTEYGVLLKDYLKLDDWVIDIENKMFTHRPDLFGLLGIAREISAIFGRPFSSPGWYKQDNVLKSDANGGLSVDNQLANDGCPRFMAVSIGGIKVEPSPLWLQSYLARCGIRPVNNIVDITNFVMIATAQPLHAYDLDKIGSDGKAELVVRGPQKDETLELIDGSSITLLPSDVVIANKQRVLGLGGIMGGKDSEVSSSTTSITLECANFDMYKIRRSSMEHGIFSEAVTRFTKGQSPVQCSPVLAYAYTLIKQLCPGASLISAVADSGENLPQAKTVAVTLKQLNSYLGEEMDPDYVLGLLNNAELNASLDAESIRVKPPFWRTDLNQAEDLIEEVGRLHGYDRLPQTLPIRRIAPAALSSLLEVKNEARHALSAAGANELLSYSFVDKKLLDACNQDVKAAFELANAISPELQYYRTSLIPSLISKVHSNHKAGYERFCLFEIGRAHLIGLNDDEQLPKEEERLALVFSANAKSAGFGPAYYTARVYLDYLLGALGIDTQKLEFSPTDKIKELAVKEAAKPFASGRSAIVSVDGLPVGLIGEFDAAVRQSLKLPQYCSGFELDLAQLAGLKEKAPAVYSPLMRFPKVYQDLTLSDEGKGYQRLYGRLSASFKSAAPEDVHWAIAPADAYQAEGTLSVNWTFRLSFVSPKRTLTDSEVNQIIDKAQKSLGL